MVCTTDEETAATDAPCKVALMVVVEAIELLFESLEATAGTSDPRALADAFTTSTPSLLPALLVLAACAVCRGEVGRSGEADGDSVGPSESTGDGCSCLLGGEGDDVEVAAAPTVDKAPPRGLSTSEALGRGEERRRGTTAPPLPVLLSDTSLWRDRSLAAATVEVGLAPLRRGPSAEAPLLLLLLLLFPRSAAVVAALLFEPLEVAAR